MGAFRFDFGGSLEALDERNAAADECIAALAKKHARFDATTGGILGLMPFGSVAAFGVQLRRQVRTLFPELVNELGYIYEADPDAVLRKRVNGWAVGESATQFVGSELATDAAADLLNQLGTSFVTEIAPDLLVEGGGGLAAGAIPILGSAAGAAIDYVLAATVTWRVGTMVSVYYQHGGFIHDRKTTYNVVKQKLVSFSNATERPGTCARVRSEIDEVRQSQIEKATKLATKLAKLNPDLATVREQLLDEWKVPVDVVDDALDALSSRSSTADTVAGPSPEDVKQALVAARALMPLCNGEKERVRAVLCGEGPGQMGMSEAAVNQALEQI